MSEAIEKTKNAITVWDDLENVRAQFAPTLTDKEFKFFVTLGSSLKANPFKREIWAVKYDKSAPASIFLGRDMYRRKAQEQPDYDGHIADAVYSKDKFTMENGMPKHSYSLADRGDLLGAYCVVYKKNQSHPFYTFVKLAEYDKGFALWKTMKETLIKKVAEAQGLRGAFQGVFAGTYDESEQWEDRTINNPKANVTPPPAIAPKTYPAEVVVEREEERAPDPEPPPYDSHPVMDGETEPPDSDDNRPNFADDIFGRLDGAVWDYCGGDKRKMYEVYKTITGFEGSDGKLRYCSDIEQVRKWKNPEKVAGSAKRVFEQRLLMKTKFKFEAEE